MNSLQRRPSVRQRLSLFREAVRGIWQGPIYSSDPNLREFFGSNVTATGVSVTEGSALTYAAVWAALNTISGDVAALPLHMFKRAKDGGKDKFIGNPTYRIVHDAPNSEMTSITWRRVTQAHALSWGNGYSEIVRDGSGRASQLWPITPDRVTPYRRGSDSGLEYRIVNRDGSDSFIPAEDMLHIHGIGFDGIQGYSPISKARESIGLGMAAERFGETFFGNGATFGGVISYAGPKPPELSEKNYRDTLNSQHQGVDKAHKFLALYNGASYTRLGIPPNDAQFLETRKFQITEIARWFNLPPHKLGDLEGATHSNIEQQTIDYYTGTLLPWLETWEQELNLKLVPSSERNIQFFEHVVDGLLRGDSASRGESFSKRFSTASITPNEIRDAENQNPIAGGDQAFVPLNMIPVPLVNAWFEADIDEKKAKAEQARRPPPTPVAPTAQTASPNRDAEFALLTEARDTARRCAQEAEDAKDYLSAKLAGIEVELEQARTERDTITAKGVEETLTHHRQIESLSLDVTVAQRDGQEAQTRADTAQREVERLTTQATSLGTDLATAVRDMTTATERIALIEADYQRVCAEKVAVEAERQAALIQMADLETGQVSLQQQIDALGVDVTAARQETISAKDRIAELEGETRRLAEERSHGDEVHLATVTELRSQIAASSQELAATTTALLEAKTAIGTLEGTREVTLSAITDAKRDADMTAASFVVVQTRLTATQQAIRATVVDAAQRLIEKEAARARKAQGSPEKLGAWVETFYSLHEDVCRDILQPAVRALLIAQGSDIAAERVLDRIVLAHISESTRQLQGVIQDADVESLGPSLERVLRRWEAERAEALADRILKEAL